MPELFLIALTSPKSLPVGRHEIFEPLVLQGEGVELTGQSINGRPATILRRGRRPDGTLYDGPLISIEHARDIRLRDLVIEGARFIVVDGAVHDERHPLTADRTSPMFPCAQRLSDPACYDRRSFTNNFASDIFVGTSSKVEIEHVTILDPVRIGIGIGAGSSEIRLNGCYVRKAGEYGIWIGYGFDPADRRLPLSADYVSRAPRGVCIDNVLVERCGSAGVYVEGRAIHLDRTRLVANCWDAPGNDESGQLTIDYKADDVRLKDCSIVGAPEIVRLFPDGGKALYGAFGIEACGSNISIENTIIEGNSREAVQIVGGRRIKFLPGTMLLNNNLAQFRHPELCASAGRQSISITTLASSAADNALADDITLDGVYCQNGLMVWSDGGAPEWVLETLVVSNSDLSGPDNSGVVEGGIGDKSLRGTHWSIRTGYDGQ